MSKQHKQAMLTDAMKSIRLAQKNSHLARDLRREVESTKAKLRRNDREMMAARNKLVKLLYGAFLYCLKVNIGTVKVEKGEDKYAYRWTRDDRECQFYGKLLHYICLVYARYSRGVFQGAWMYALDGPAIA